MPDDDTAHLLASKLGEEGTKSLIHSPDMVLTFHNLPTTRATKTCCGCSASQATSMLQRKKQDEKITSSGIGLGGSGGN